VQYHTLLRIWRVTPRCMGVWGRVDYTYVYTCQTIKVCCYLQSHTLLCACCTCVCDGKLCLCMYMYIYMSNHQCVLLSAISYSTLCMLHDPHCMRVSMGGQYTIVCTNMLIYVCNSMQSHLLFCVWCVTPRCMCVCVGGNDVYVCICKCMSGCVCV